MPYSAISSAPLRSSRCAIGDAGRAPEWQGDKAPPASGSGATGHAGFRGGLEKAGEAREEGTTSPAGNASQVGTRFSGEVGRKIGVLVWVIALRPVLRFATRAQSQLAEGRRTPVPDCFGQELDFARVHMQRRASTIRTLCLCVPVGSGWKSCSFRSLQRRSVIKGLCQEKPLTDAAANITGDIGPAPSIVFTHRPGAVALSANAVGVEF